MNARAGGPAATDGKWHRPGSGFQLLGLIVESITDAALPQAGDVLIELTVLPPQRGNRHDQSVMHVPQVKDDFVQGRLTARRAPANRATIPLFSSAAHHTSKLRHINAKRQYFRDEGLGGGHTWDYIYAAT